MKSLVSILLLLFVSGCLSGPTTPPEDTTETLIKPTEVFLPGSQPEEGLLFETQLFCYFCHGNYSNYSPYDTWRGSMMSHAGRDPIFLAALAISNKDFDGIAEVGDYCLRCHTPKAWLEGRSKPVDGSALSEAEKDFDGVICDFCHRMVDPFTEEGKKLQTNGTVDAYHNSQFIVSPQSTKRGPYQPIATGHVSEYSDFHTRSDFCGTCHDIDNPLYGNEPLERTYTEWRYSAYGLYASDGNQVSCQDCHMPAVEDGFACAIREARVLRDKVYRHDFAGGSTCVQDMLVYLYDIKDQTTLKALQKSKENAEKMLQSAAELELSKDGGNLKVKVINRAGHKLPTGYSEGRIMWVNVKFYDSNGKIIKESGKYDPEEARLLVDPELKTYEIKPGIKYVGITEALPDRLGIPEGPSFHFAANNYIYYDNRIPPAGFRNKDYEEYKAYIRGASYADGQNWDITLYSIPQNSVSAEVRLYYQSLSREYVEFLYAENLNNDIDFFKAGEKLYEAWRNTGMCKPIEMTRAIIQF
jgi:hypothetical protein